MSFSKFTKSDFDRIAKEYASLEESARRRCQNEEEFQTIRKAFEFANEAHKNVRRLSGEPYILHPIAVAKIVVNDIGLGYKSITAALLHDVVEDTNYTIDDIRNLFGDKIASLVDGLTKIKTVLDNENKGYMLSPESEQADNFKRILLTLNDDARVVLIKLADRLHNCRTIEFQPEHKRDKVLAETMFVFIPLAHRLGLYEIKSEMENIWLRYKEPEAYQEIRRRVSENVEDKEKEIDDFIQPIREALRRACFDFEIRKRVKTPYSIWHKMQTKNVPFEQVYDLYAVRIIFTPDPGSVETERDQCYHIFSIITGIYRYQPERIRDWVNHPKSNGYEALHCTLLGKAGLRVEVQIRSKRMDDIAEKGIAAHWAYKKEGYLSEQHSEMDKWLAKIKDILMQKGDISSLELLDMIHEDLTEKEIIVFTPKGEQRSIMRGATALDFAYLIHSHIGSQAIAAKVNMKLVPLDHVLQSGDQVEIITAESGEPKKEWLQFLRTRHAINLVIDYFRDYADELRKEGEKILTSQMRKVGRHLSNRNIKHLLLTTQLPSRDELCFRLALGLVKPEDIAASFTNWDLPVAPMPDNYVVDSRTETGVRRYIVASCCGPIPGDPVIGFRSPDGTTVTIHKKSCPVAQAVAAKHGEWVVVPDRDDVKAHSSFPVRISLKGIDRVGLLSEITHYISQVMGINMTRLMLSVNGGIFEGYIEMYVADKKLLNRMIKKLSSMDGIESVERTEI